MIVVSLVVVVVAIAVIVASVVMTAVAATTVTNIHINSLWNDHDEFRNDRMCTLLQTHVMIVVIATRLIRETQRGGRSKEMRQEGGTTHVTIGSRWYWVHGRSNIMC